MSVEPFVQARVRRSGGNLLDRRVTALEHEVAIMKSTVAQVEQNTAQILAILEGSKTAFAYVKKYGRQTAMFGAGIMTSAGFLNPKVGAFIATFFA